MVISRGVDRYVTEISAGCKQSMYSETVPQQDASSSTEQSVAHMAFASRSRAKAPPKRSAEPSSPPVKLAPPHLTGKVSKVLIKIKKLSILLRTQQGEILGLSRRPHQSREIHSLCEVSNRQIFATFNANGQGIRTLTTSA